jgi:hypothetical protein
LPVTVEMRVCGAEWMRFLRNKDGRLSYTYRQAETTDEVRNEMERELGYVDEEELNDDEEELNDDDDL